MGQGTEVMLHKMGFTLAFVALAPIAQPVQGGSFDDAHGFHHALRVASSSDIIQLLTDWG